MTIDPHPDRFYFKDCTLSAIATGDKAQNLKELYNKISTIHQGSIYYHFWGGRLRPMYEKREYHNDFAMWCYNSLHDQTLAERLSIIDPTDFEDLELLRGVLLDTIETRLDELEHLPWVAKNEDFHFIRSKIIIFNTDYVISEPHELIRILPKLSPSSIFYHFIDAYRRTPLGVDDFSAWLQGFDNQYKDLIQTLQEIDFYFVSLGELQNTLTGIFTSHFVRKVEEK